MFGGSPPFRVAVTVKAEELQPAALLLRLTGRLDGSAKNTTVLTLPAAVIQQRVSSCSPLIAGLQYHTACGTVISTSLVS